MPQIIVNYLVIISAALINMLIGYVWFSSFLFGAKWSSLNEKNRALKKVSNLIYLFTFIASLVMSYILAVIISFTEIKSAVGGAFMGFILWLGFVASTGMISHLYSNRSNQLFMIDNGYYLVSMMIMGAVLAVFY